MTVVDLKKRTKRSYKRAPRDLVPLDQNSGPGKFFSKMVRDIQGDLGGRRELTRIENELVGAFCGAATHLQYLNHQLLLGESSEIDLAGYSQIASTMLRIGSKLGVQRRAKLVPGLHDPGGLLDQIVRSRDEGDSDD